MLAKRKAQDRGIKLRPHHSLPKSESLKIQKGQIWVYRVFDVAEEIDLQAVEQLLTPKSDAGKAEAASKDPTSSETLQSRLTLARSPKQALMIRNAPVRLRMGSVRLEGVSEAFDVYVTVYDYGVFSFCFQLPMPEGCTFDLWLKQAEQLGPDMPMGVILAEIARSQSRELISALQDALRAPAERQIFEDYILHFIEKVEGIERGQDLLSQADIAALILAETREKLSQKTREEIHGGTFQYSEGDLAVIDWNSALILEPSGARDSADVIEFVLTHLLEFRYYDALLDERLSELYDAIERRRAQRMRFQALWKEDFAELSREANTRYLEFSELIERIDNSLKVVGDSYLAVIFRGAVRRFRLSDWKESVSRKHGIFAQVSTLLQGEINVSRGHTLELIVIVLIAFELISAVIRNL